MINYMDYFEQTSKAILFEKFAEKDMNEEELPCLRRYLTEDDVVSDRFFKKVEEKLGVSSFEEFMDKFTPWIYEIITSGDEEDSVEIKYSLEKPKGYDDTGMNPTALNATALYEMVNRLYEQRKNSGKAQLDFDFSDISEILSPESQTKKIKQARRDMEAYIQEYYRLEEKTPGVPSAEKENCIKMFNRNRFEVRENYIQGSSAMLTLKLGDASTALLEMKESAGGGSFESGRERKIGVPFYDEDGNLKFRELETSEEEAAKIETSTPAQKMLEILTEDYQSSAPDYMKDNKEITNLVLSNISTELARTNHDESFWKERLESGQEDYKRWTENLAKTIAPLIEKFMGVKAFFENATSDGNLDSKLIIANSTVEELIQTDTIKNNLSKFLCQVNRKRQQKIWFGIMPAIALGNEVTTKRGYMPKNISDNPFGSIDEIEEEKEEKVYGLVSAENAKILLDICKEAKIMTFFNYKANENTCFGNINKETYDLMKNQMNFEDGSYAVCCFPNFTIIPKEETTVIINKELVEKGCQEKYVSLEIPSIYVEASYVAAGMMVGSQQRKLLQKKGLEVEPKFTNIRVDFEDKVVYKKYQSNMCIENLLPCPKDMDEEIMDLRFGFYFSDTEITGDKGKMIKHCYVRNARTMEKRGERYVKINNKLFEDFILMRVCDGQETIDPENISSFINEDVQEWSEYAQVQEQEEKETKNPIVNALLKAGENINCLDNVTIEIDYLHEKGYVKPKIEAK